MSDANKIMTPLSDELVKSLKAGDRVLVTGTVYTARDIAHKRLCQLIENGKNLPFDISGSVIYFVGPTPATQNRPIGAASPTTSSRMDEFSPSLIERGLKAMIGKGYRSDKVRDALKKNSAVHFAATGGAGALLSKHITSSEIISYEDLGTEAIRKLEVKDFPVVVAYDAHGNTVYAL